MLPVGAVPERRLDTLVGGVGFRHRLADENSFRENLLLPFIRLEGLALLDAEELELRQDQPIALDDRIRAA